MSANFSDTMRKQRGFTLMELVTIVVILGILAVVAIPRLGDVDYKSREFRDKVVSALRYAQKSAVSHRRMVCVSFTATSVSLSMDTANGGAACASPLLIPGANSQTLNSADPSKAYFTPSNNLADLIFASDGSSGGRTLSIIGQDPIVVEGATGYVN